MKPREGGDDTDGPGVSVISHLKGHERVLLIFCLSISSYLYFVLRTTEGKNKERFTLQSPNGKVGFTIY